MLIRYPLLSVSLTTLLACGSQRDADESPFDAAEGGGPASDGTAGSGAAGDDNDGDDGDDDDDGNDDDDPGGDDSVFDVGGGAADGVGPSEGCGKIDFLFVIDNSSSMTSAQTSVRASFPGFLEAIEDNVAAQDFHIMVIDSDGDPTFACEESVHMNEHPLLEGSACGIESPFPIPGVFDICEGYDCGQNNTELDALDKTIGCGVVKPYGGQAANMECGVEGDRRYLTDAHPALPETFDCISRVGISGSYIEQPMTALRAAVSPAFNAAGGCNEGFLRDDAVLVIVVISDDVVAASEGIPDDVVPGAYGTPSEWYDDVLAAKNGVEEAIVVLGVFADADADKFVDFVELFGERGRVVSVTEPDYSVFFDPAVELIDTTCDNLPPEG